MEKERMYIPSGLKTRDGKDIMCYTSEFYIKNKEKIEKLIRRCEEVLLEDNLITSKAMLIEKARNKVELYKNIEDMINNQKRIDKFENSQLEKIVKYELAGTEDESIINKFIEKIRNREEKDEIMMNAARIINKEIRKQRKEGMEQGILQGKFMIAKKLKGRMTVEEISQITGLSKKEIEEL